MTTNNTQVAGKQLSQESRPLILGFGDLGNETDLVGGKGKNLALMTQAGFPVPSGVTVTTEAYHKALQSSGVREQLVKIVNNINYDDPAQVEKSSAQIRDVISQIAMPKDIVEEISQAYEQLGQLTDNPSPYVAVRSSGTAEDMAEASFAGLHDTYLDIKGIDSVLKATNKCWASMWTARAVAYRKNNGFDHFEVGIAVVVQIMVEAEVAGVLFTANPITERTDEMLVNASWGLGEAVVSGSVTPDEFLLRKSNLKVKRKTLGSKEMEFRRKQGGGTLQKEVSADRRQQFSLVEEQLQKLGEMGRNVENHYSRLPQDIEWAFANNTVYLLQSRPVTGAFFCWEEDLMIPEKIEDEENTIWEKTWAEEGLTGANCPLFFTTRGWNYDRCFTNQLEIYGLDEPSTTNMHFKYYRGAVYYNTATEKAFTLHTMIPHARNSLFCWGGTRYIEPEAHEEIVNAPFDWFKFLKMIARLQLDPKNSYLGCRNYCMKKWFQREQWDPKNFCVAELRPLTDDALKRKINHWLKEEETYCDEITMWFFNLRDGINLLAWLVDEWYDGENPTAMMDLISGASGKTPTSRENDALWDFAQRIKSSPALLETFEQHKEEEFFVALEKFEEGRGFLTSYQAFADEHPHRGHSDRDFIYLRRGENPAVDYRAFQALMTADSEDSPAKREKETNARRTAVVAEVVGVIEKQSLGALKVQAFKAVLAYVGQFLVERDLERYSYDKHTYILKLHLLELARRLLKRGQLSNERDIYFLGKDELFSVLDGQADRVLIKAKIAGRMRNFDAYHNKEWNPPPYIVRGEAYDPSLAFDDSDPSRLRGIQQSRGTVTGKARIVKTLDKIGTIKKGEILVCNGTDPGWTPAFLIISGIVTETGGVLSHAACLSREYGLPAVQLPLAIQRIPDGATITVDGDVGEVKIEDAI